MNFYQAFGLSIASEIPLPELSVGREPGAVRIRKGQVAISEEAALSGRNFRLEMSEGRFTLEVAEVGRFSVRDGCEVLVERATGAAAEDLRLFLLGSVLGALLIQRGCSVLHGSAVDYNGRAVAFLGRSGVGKSTLANAFRVYCGAPMISDDVCALGFDGPKSPQVYPGYPQSKLWLDSLAMLGIEESSLRPVGLRMDKRALPVLDGFGRQARPLACLYVLEWGGSRPSIECVVGAQKALLLLSETYRSEFVGGLAMRAQHFSNVAEVASKVRVRRLVRPTHGCDPRRVVQLVEHDLETLEI